MKILLLSACCLASLCSFADGVITNVTLTVAQKVDILWAAHTNRLAHVAASKQKDAKPKTAIQQVRENAEKHKRRSGMGKSAGGVK